MILETQFNLDCGKLHHTIHFNSFPAPCGYIHLKHLFIYIHNNYILSIYAVKWLNCYTLTPQGNVSINVIYTDNDERLRQYSIVSVSILVEIKFF